jgi:hypothetical protein
MEKNSPASMMQKPAEGRRSAPSRAFPKGLIEGVMLISSLAAPAVSSAQTDARGRRDRGTLQDAEQDAEADSMSGGRGSPGTAYLLHNPSVKLGSTGLYVLPRPLASAGLNVSASHTFSENVAAVKGSVVRDESFRPRLLAITIAGDAGYSRLASPVYRSGAPEDSPLLAARAYSAGLTPAVSLLSGISGVPFITTVFCNLGYSYGTADNTVYFQDGSLHVSATKWGIFPGLYGLDVRFPDISQTKLIRFDGAGLGAAGLPSNFFSYAAFSANWVRSSSFRLRTTLGPGAEYLFGQFSFGGKLEPADATIVRGDQSASFGPSVNAYFSPEDRAFAYDAGGAFTIRRGSISVSMHAGWTGAVHHDNKPRIEPAFPSVGLGLSYAHGKR